MSFAFVPDVDIHKSSEFKKSTFKKLQEKLVTIESTQSKEKVTQSYDFNHMKMIASQERVPSMS